MPLTRIVALAASSVLLAVLTFPAVAQEQQGETTTTVAGGATETVAEETGPSYTPAVTVAPEAEAEPVAPWTARYLVPTGLVLAALAVFVTVVQYFVRVVRNRYKVVE